jgi:single-stranded DNA-specific DHH superfamily exonuclease
MFEEITGNGLIIHHWDADGISSARLILEYFKNKNITNATPQLGNYYLTEEEINNYSKYDYIFIVDMSLPKDNILQLAQKAKVMIFDHHLGPEIIEVLHHNPIIKGQNPDDHPSASWIVNDYLKNPVNLYAILGIIGDHEQKIKNNQKFSEIINSFCINNNLTFEDLHKMVYLLDSNYKLGDKQAVEHAPHELLEMTLPQKILNNTTWNENLHKLETEMTKQLNIREEEINGILIKRIDTTYNIISTITRKVAWNSGKNTIVINPTYFPDKSQVYVRSTTNIEPMIARGKELGFKCGGKKEVLGAIIPKEETDGFVNEIITFLTTNE